MEFEPDISRLETVVSRLLEEYDVVKKECQKLTIDLAESVAQVEALEVEKITMLNEKDTVHSRVSTILEKLSDWEEGFGDNKKTEEDSVPKETGGQLFSMETPS